MTPEPGRAQLAAELAEWKDRFSRYIDHVADVEGRSYVEHVEGDWTLADVDALRKEGWL